MAATDRLTGSTVALAMDVELNPQEHQCQDVAAGELTGDTQGQSVLESLAKADVTTIELPEQRGLETANQKVPTHTLTLRRAPRTTSFIFWSHPS